MKKGKSRVNLNPYEGLPPSSYWRIAVAERHPMDFEDMYTPKYIISNSDAVMVAGSCFAQHVGRELRQNGYSVLDVEKAPEGLDEETAQGYGYGVYSARYGNIYSPRQLLQLIRDCQNATIRREDFWHRDGRYYDALRPSVEPEGLESVDEAIALRIDHLRAVKRLIAQTDVLIFTLGLTEAWMHRRSGTIYPSCPGVMAGEFDPTEHVFVNFGYEDIMADLTEIRSLLRRDRPGLRILLTVSPVPLTATASGQNVLVATTYSKSVLRAACGSLVAKHGDIDYFPSYEMIASPAARGYFYEPNMRSVNGNGVQYVMRTFMRSHGAVDLPADTAAAKPTPRATPRRDSAREVDDVVCEEALLGAFAK
jgi:hypothetical protein